MSIDAAIAIAWDVLKMGFAPIKRGFGFVKSSKSYADNLRQEVENLDDETWSVRSAEGRARNNHHDIRAWVPKFLESAENASKQAKDLLREFEEASKTCCRGTIPDPVCRFQFSRKAKRKADDIQKLIQGSKGKEISFIGPEAYAADLRKEVGNLEDEAERVGFLETEARYNVRNFRDVFETWKANVEEALKEAQDLLGDFERASKTCGHGTLPDACCDACCPDQFCTKAEAQIKVVRDLAQQCSDRFKKLDDISCIPATGNVVTAPNPARRVQSRTATASVFSASSSIKRREDGLLESRALMIEKVMDALANNSNSVVGIHGMGGVGKSTLLVDAEKRIRAKKSFNWVAKADVSQNPDIKKIQKEIARCLGLSDLDKEEYVSERAKLLHKRLEKEEREKKKVLIILDNLWERLDLDKVGIPCGHDNKAIGCKLLLTSRYENVLLSEMRCDCAFPLGVLKEEEAERLFVKVMGGKVEVELEPLVEEALRICAGLPFLIVAISKLFINASYSDCKHALKHMWSEETGKVITRTLQLSYGRISDEAKSLLRLCVAYGVSKPSLEDLARYGFGLGIFQKVNSMQEARVRLLRLIHILQATSLLLDGDEDADGFKIHGLVREFVASFASTNHPLLILKDKDKSVTELSEDKLKSCEAICFPYVNLEELPKELICPELRIFLLFSNNESLEISDSYFNSMKNLMALHLTSIRLSRSPSPFQFLENLHSLCLHYCLLEDVAILGELKGLQILSLQNSNIQRLPKEIGQLTELRLLDLDNCSELHTIEPGVLGRLTKLEELYMENSFHQWSAEEQTPPINANLIELNNMKNLHTLHVSIPNLCVLPKDLNFMQLTKYRIQIGDVQRWLWSEYKGSRTLELKLDPTSNILQKECIQSILCRTDDMYLDRLNRTEQSISRLSIEGFPKLKLLQVEDSPSIRYILEWSSFPAFKALETLLLKNMINLEKITNNNISSESFNTLKVVRVESCDKMEVLFPRSVVRELPLLEEIEVEGCELMRGIVEVDDDCGKLELPKLCVLKLRDLPNIKNFITARSSPSSSTSNDQVGAQIAFFNGQQVAFPRLETLEIRGLNSLRFTFSPSIVKSLAQLRNLTVRDCKKMEAIIMEEEESRVEILETLAFPMLTVLRLEKLESLGGECSRESQSQADVQSHSSALFNRKVTFPKLESLEITSCDNVGFMFFPSTVKSLAQLRKLSVMRCEKMEAIIMEEEGLSMKTSETLTFPMLTDLSLEFLKSLTCFSHGSQETRNQDHVKSRSIVFFSQEVAFPKLESLEITSCDNVGFMFFPSTVKFFAQLRKLSVDWCGKMEAIIMEEEGLRMETSETLAFPMLTYLSLTYLASLTCFSHGSRESPSQDRVKSRSTALFSREVAFPSLETLYIADMDNIETLWDNQVVADSFPKLKSLCVDGCNTLATVVPSFVLGQLLCLESLEVQDCGSLEVVFELLPLLPLDGHPIPLPLRELTVSRLPKLKCVWDKELHHQVKFQRLRSISISECKSLTSFFPVSVTRDLIQLEELEIRECGIVELIQKEEGLLVPKFIFPNLASLKLMCLTELKSLYSETHTSHWPALKTLEVADCCKLEILVSQTESEIPRHEQSLFLIEKGAFPNLQELKLDLSEQVEIWHGNFRDEESFRKLKVLELRHLSKEYAISTCCFVGSLTNLEELVVSEFYPEESANNVEAIDGPCQAPQVILPLPRRIQHLNTLDVSDCDGLSSTFTPTIAENLVALTKLRISNCRTLTNVISDQEFEEERVVAFKQLKYMELEGLIGLRCFSSSGYALVFPVLEDVIVNECPNMKVFSEGQIEAPKLESVKVGLKERYGRTKYQYFWKGNLNITIQNMYEEVASIAEAQFMRLSEFSKLIEKWHGDLNPLRLSWQLETLVVDKCPSFINAMPSKLMLVLEKIRSLQVCDCESLEEIFDLQGLESVESTWVLPCLDNLQLINLPKLRQLWNKDLQGMMRFNSLSFLTLYKCSNLRHAFTPSMAWCLVNLEYMEIRECDQMEGAIEEEEGLGSTVEKITFPNLRSILLKWLPNLTSFLSGKNHALDCPKMESLTIAHCPKMSSLTWQSSMDIDHSTPSLFTPQVQFPGLGWMFLSHMDNLSKIWPDNPLETLTFDSLMGVDVQNCESLENLFPHWVATSLTQLKELQVESCRMEEIVANGDDTPHSSIAQVLFLKLTSLVLHDMPRLKTFCPNLPTLNWPFLEELRVTHCNKVNMLSFAASVSDWTQRDDQQELSNQEAQTTFERDFPNLERLLLVNEDIQMIRDGKYPNDIFGKPKALTLACFHEENAIFPSKFLLERFQNLESLEVFCSSFEDIFPNEGLVDEEKHPMLESLRQFKLSKLYKLKCVWREDYLMVKILQSITTFEVCDCPCLTTLFPSAASFQNLTELVVKNSSGLVRLGTVSAIASLVHLEDITIIGCEKMKEVMANDENEEGEIISFGELRKLTLQNMPSLECFSSATSCILRFPSLWEIELEECPKMKIFSKGMLSTPELGYGTLFRYELNEVWKGDLNRVIRELSA